MLNVTQQQLAKELLNNTDATVQGILLAAIVILIAFIGFLWKSKISDEKYIREQDKANLELYMTITNTMDDISKNTEKHGNKLDNVHDNVMKILNIILERLKNDRSS